MLVLTRRCGEQIQIGDQITITIVRVTNQGVRIGVDAPRESMIARGELLPADDADAVDAEQDS
ncbi:MAG: carbon storage regulator [Planctomycetales bacterium]|nr:carbon storage regulator [Planctomycetales bacterium]